MHWWLFGGAVVLTAMGDTVPPRFLAARSLFYGCAIGLVAYAALYVLSIGKV